MQSAKASPKTGVFFIVLFVIVFILFYIYLGIIAITMFVLIWQLLTKSKKTFDSYVN